MKSISCEEHSMRRSYEQGYTLGSAPTLAPATAFSTTRCRNSATLAAFAKTSGRTM